MVTPCFTTVAFNSLNTQFPPCSTAISTMTDPYFMLFTMSSVTRTGAFLPGMRAVVMTKSAVATCLETSSCCFFKNSSDTPFTYPPSILIESSSLTMMNFPPNDSTCSLVSGRISDTSTIEPKRFAVAMACSPATPAPKMSTLEGLMVPAAVINIGNIFPRALAPIITLL